MTGTPVQIEMFADVLGDGSVLEAIIDRADPAAQPFPRPDLRRAPLPIGAVAIFAAGNFPLPSRWPVATPRAPSRPAAQ
jgi:NADP-dependent aldehyde dehydrogenase